MKSNIINNLKQNRIFILLSLVLGLLFYLQAQYYIPSLDDNVYAFMANDQNKGDIYNVLDDQYPRTPISSIKDAIHSQQSHYFHTNGRFIAHTIVQSCSGLLSHNQYAFLISIVFGIFIYVLLKLIREKKWNIHKYFFFILSLMLLFPSPSVDCWMGISTSVNYLMTGTLFFTVYLLYENKIKNNKNTLTIGEGFIIACLAFLLGAFQESFTIGFCGAFVLYYIVNYKEITLRTLLFCIPLFVGAALLVFSPSNFQRRDSIEGLKLSVTALYDFITAPAIFALCITLVILFITKRHLFTQVIKENMILLLTMMINFIFCLLIAYMGLHQMYGVSIIALLLCYRIWYKLFTKFSLKYTILLVFLLFPIMLQYGRIVNLRKHLYEGYVSIVEQASHHTEFINGEKYFNAMIDVENRPVIANNYVYVVDLISRPNIRKSFAIMLSKGTNSHLLDKLCPYSYQKIEQLCNKRTQIASEFYQPFPTLIIHKTRDNQTTNKITLIRKGHRLFFPHMNEDITSFNSFEYKGNHYSLFKTEYPIVKLLKASH